MPITLPECRIRVARQLTTRDARYSGYDDHPPRRARGEPDIDGTRGGGPHVAALVSKDGQSPPLTADQFDISTAEGYEALSDDYARIDETREMNGRTRSRD